jgi:hypothetical protein
MNKNKRKIDLIGYKHKTTFDVKPSNANNFSLNTDKKNNIDLSVHYKQNKIIDNDFKDLTNIVRNSVEKINNLFNQEEFKSKKFFQKEAKEIKLPSDIDEYEELNKSTDNKKNERVNTSVQKTSKTNFTFNINNFINVPNISTTMPNISHEKNSIEAREKASMRSAITNKHSKNNKIYLNNINNKKNLLIESKGISNKKFGSLYENHNYNNYSTINESLYQIDEVQTTNTTTNINNKKINLKNNTKNIKISVNSRGSRANYNSYLRSDLSKSIKDTKDSIVNTPAHNEKLNNITLSGLTTINQNTKKVIFRIPNNNKKKKELTSLNVTSKVNDYNKTFNRMNKYKMKQNEVNQNASNKNTLKRNNNDLNKNKVLNSKNKLSESKKLFRTGDDFYSNKQENDKNKEIKINKSINLEDITSNIKVSLPQREEKNKIKIKKPNIKIALKTMDDINNNKYKKNYLINNISDRASTANSPISIKSHSIKKRGGSIHFERKLSEKNERESSYRSSSRMFHQVVNIFYGKAFPNKINTNEILKLMLFLNEYLINNNLLNDYYLNENRKILDDYSKFLSSLIKVDFPEEHDIVVDPTIKCIKKIQRKWRKKKIEKYLEKNKKNENNELKQMIVNKYIKKSGYKIKKILGLFNTIVENFDNIHRQSDNNELFYQIQKLINNKLTEYEKNILYKEFINNVIIVNNYN